MIDEASQRAAPFDSIIVHSFSRFFRDQFQLEFYVRRLAKNGVPLMSITQELGDDPMSAMMRQIMALFGEYKSKENAKHATCHARERAPRLLEWIKATVGRASRLDGYLACTGWSWTMTALDWLPSNRPRPTLRHVESGRNALPPRGRGLGRLRGRASTARLIRRTITLHIARPWLLFAEAALFLDHDHAKRKRCG